jgi:alkylation response protein AidB-like acyl-CoA dehydrogenase
VASGLLGKDAADWQLLADAGWTGLEVGEDLGGAGASFGEVAIILEEMGRAAARSAYLGGAVLAVGALNALRTDATRDKLLADVATGTERAAAVLSPFAIEPTRAGLKITGRAEFVPDADGADRLLLLADAGDGPVIVDVASGADGLSVTSQPVLDGTRRLSVVEADTTVDESAVRTFDGDPGVQVSRLFDRAAAAIACDSLGVSEAMLSATVSYVSVRHQFGRPIGSFQAVKHACADMFVRISVARQLVTAAVDAITNGHPDATTATSMAKAYATGAAVDIAGKAMQLHGGIGYTWESGIHVYLKRALLNRSLFGSPATHRKHLTKRYR